MKNLKFNQEVTDLFLKGGSIVKTCISSDNGFLVSVIRMPKNNYANDIIFKSNRKFEYAIISNWDDYSKIEITSLHNGNFRRIKNICDEQYKHDISCYRKKTKSLEYIY